jgi:hypothetical protein
MSQSDGWTPEESDAALDVPRVPDLRRKNRPSGGLKAYFRPALRLKWAAGYGNITCVEAAWGYSEPQSTVRARIEPTRTCEVLAHVFEQLLKIFSHHI